jgi:dihydrolipoyl dehydrogenase
MCVPFVRHSLGLRTAVVDKEWLGKA